jgi:hypothetical protein
LYPHLAIYLPINSEGPYKGHNCGTKRATAKSIATIPAESIPFIEVAVLVADIGYELYPACETVRDLDQLYSDLGMADEAPEDAMHSVATQSCQMRGKSRCDWPGEQAPWISVLLQQEQGSFWSGWQDSKPNYR